MPTYIFECEKCGELFEEMQKINAVREASCPKCGELTSKLRISLSSFTLKGGGWAKDGYSKTKKPITPAKTRKSL